jgi:hypothetical protein
MTYIWWFFIGTGLVLQLLVIAVVLKRRRGFHVLFFYLILLFLSTVFNAAAYYNPGASLRAARYYWISDAIRQAFIFVLVLSFIHSALIQRQNRTVLRRRLWAGACIYVLASLYFTWDPRIGYWMTNLSRNLAFLAVILNLVLWAALIQYKRDDRILLMVSGGMGIEMAGKAIGHSLRQLSKSTQLTGDLILVITHLLCLYIWWQAFRRPEPAGRRATNPS